MAMALVMLLDIDFASCYSDVVAMRDGMPLLQGIAGSDPRRGAGIDLRPRAQTGRRIAVHDG
jgi:hypothetical protein